MDYPNWKDKISSLSPLAEQQGRLTDEILEIAYTENWFKLFVPTQYGGPGKKLPEILRLEEELAHIDGSLGWTVTLCAGAGWFAGFLDKQLAKDVFADPRVCFAGSGAVGGTATKTENGYLINGHWNYASGALHATVFTANCSLKNTDGADIINQDGSPEVLSFILKKEEVNILPSWSYFGLIATGSHAFEVNNIEVPDNRTFKINETIAVANEGFDYPFLQLAETTLAVNSLGMALHFIDLAEIYFYQRSGLKRFSEEQIAFFEAEFNGHKNELLALKRQFYGAFDETWQQLITDKLIRETSSLKISQLSRALAHCARNTVDAIYPYCGLEAAKKDTELNRVYRDLHTASQHALLTFK